MRRSSGGAARCEANLTQTLLAAAPERDVPQELCKIHRIFVCEVFHIFIKYKAAEYSLIWTRLLRSTEYIRLSSILHLSKLNFRAEKSQKDAAQYYKFAEEHATKGILKFSGNQGEVRPAARFAAHLRLGKIPSNISELFDELVTCASFE